MRDALRARLVTLLREEAGVVASGRLCPRCGSASHGAPWARRADGTGVAVSFSYALGGAGGSDGLGVVAWAPVTAATDRIGLDVERVTDPSPDAVAALRDWTITEARAKATGHGLLAVGSGGRPDLPTHDVDLPPGFVGALCGPGAEDVVVRWVRLVGEQG